MEEKVMNREEFLQKIDEINQQRKVLRKQELTLIDEYINTNKPKILYGEEVVVKADGVELHGFLGGWSINEQGFIVPIIHKRTQRGTMNMRSVYYTQELTEYTIELA